jgi:predicted phosphodiesterase
VNILVIGDTHIPFVHKNYLEFVFETGKKFQCGKVIHIGDLIDFHSISRHEHNPDGFSPKAELEKSKSILKKWYLAFPELDCCIGNHDERLEKAAIRSGLTSLYFKSFKSLFDMPDKWDYRFDVRCFGVRFFHGMGWGGKYAHINAAMENGQSIVMGHLHGNAGVEWMANDNQIIFGMAVGCGIDRKTYAFNYGRDHRRKPILGCGVVFDCGRDAQFIPMKM